MFFYYYSVLRYYFLQFLIWGQEGQGWLARAPRRNVAHAIGDERFGAGIVAGRGSGGQQARQRGQSHGLCIAAGARNLRSRHDVWPDEAHARLARWGGGVLLLLLLLLLVMGIGVACGLMAVVRFSARHCMTATLTP